LNAIQQFIFTTISERADYLKLRTVTAMKAV